MLKICIELFKTGIWGSQNRVTFPWEEAVKASINVRQVRVGLVISVDREQGARMDHITSVPATLLTVFIDVD
jgi:hypothetical protein